MDGQIFGGGVMVLVAVLLWLAYLLPALRRRHEYNRTERNAVRLGQALRVLAETSETPEQMRVELTARAALAQQRAAKAAEAQAAREEREQKRLLAEAEAERERTLQAQRRAMLEEARRTVIAARNTPEVRRMHARRRTRLSVTALTFAALVLVGIGAWQSVVSGGVLWAWILSAAVVAALGIGTLVQLARVSKREALSRRAMPTEARSRAAAALPASVLEAPVAPSPRWTPRSLPDPLTRRSGSQAAAVHDAHEAREAWDRAARQEEQRQRVTPRHPEPVPFTATGQADDAAIEAHVRALLARRAAG